MKGESRFNMLRSEPRMKFVVRWADLGERKPRVVLWALFIVREAKTIEHDERKLFFCKVKSYI